MRSRGLRGPGRGSLFVSLSLGGGGGGGAPPMRDSKFKFDERVKNDWDAHGNLLRPAEARLLFSSRRDDPNSGPLKFVAGAIK